ncbi:MAG: hypothetical protein VW622_13565, partial [Opitutae bacterium]
VRAVAQVAPRPRKDRRSSIVGLSRLKINESLKGGGFSSNIQQRQMRNSERRKSSCLRIARKSGITFEVPLFGKLQINTAKTNAETRQAE